MPPLTPIWTLACKDLRLLARDRAGVFFTAVFPVAFAVMFGLVFGQAGGGDPAASSVPLAVVDLDATDDAERLARTIGDLEGVELTTGLDREGAIGGVRRGDLALAVIIPEGYADALGGIFGGEPVSLGIVYDPARGAQRLMLEGQLQGVVFGELGGVLGDADRRLAAADQMEESLAAAEGLPPLQRVMLSQGLAMLRAPVEDDGTDAVTDAGTDGAAGEDGGGALGIRLLELDSVSVAGLPADGEEADGGDTSGRLTNAFELTIPQGVAWGLMGCVLGFGLSLAQEAQGGTLRRLLASPIRPWHLLAGKGLACLMVAIGVQALLYLVSVTVFGVDPDSWAMLALAAMAGAFAFAGLMLAFAGLARTVGAAEGLGRAVLLTLALLGGAGVPLFLMPGWMQAGASVSPFKWLILAHETALWRGTAGIDAALPFLVLAVIGLGGTIAGAVLFSRGRHRVV